MNFKLKLMSLATVAAVAVTCIVGGTAEAKTKKKTDPAKKECLADNPSLKGKKLAACIKKKKAAKAKAAKAAKKHKKAKTPKAKATPDPMMDSGPGPGHEAEP